MVSNELRNDKIRALIKKRILAERQQQNNNLDYSKCIGIGCDNIDKQDLMAGWNAWKDLSHDEALHLLNKFKQQAGEEDEM